MKDNLRENYYTMQAKIKKLGPIKKLVNDFDAIRRIIAYDGDRHYLCAFIDEINEALESKVITGEDLHYFRSGEFADAIVHLKETINEVNPHELQTAERLDKINYISLLEDAQSLAVSYTHPEIIDALCGESMDPSASDLVWWSNSGTFSSLPGNVQIIIVNEVLKRGNLEAAQKLTSQSTYGLSPYPSNDALRR